MKARVFLILAFVTVLLASAWIKISDELGLGTSVKASIDALEDTIGIVASKQNENNAEYKAEIEKLKLEINALKEEKESQKSDCHRKTFLDLLTADAGIDQDLCMVRTNICTVTAASAGNGAKFQPQDDHLFSKNKPRTNIRSLLCSRHYSPLTRTMSAPIALNLSSTCS